MGKFDEHMSLGDMSIYVEEQANNSEIVLRKLQEALGSSAIDEATISRIANAVASLGETAAKILVHTDEAYDLLEANTNIEATDEPKASVHNPQLEQGRPAEIDFSYALQLYEDFARRSGYYSTKDLKEYFAQFDEEFSPEDVKRLMKLHAKLRRELIVRMQQTGENVMLLEEGERQSKQYAIGFIQGDQSSQEPTEDQLATISNDEAALDQPVEVIKRFPVINFIDDGFAIEKMSTEEVSDVLTFVTTIIDSEEEVVSSEMKQRVIDEMKNKRVTHESAKLILDKIYQLRCIGKVDKNAKVYYVQNPKHRRLPRENRESLKKETKEVAVDYVGMGVEHVFNALVEKVQHYEKRLTPKDISNHLAGKGITVPEKDIKRIARSLSMYFVSGQASQANSKSPHAKSRGLQVFKVGLKNQDVKERWKADPASVLAEIAQMQS